MRRRRYCPNCGKGGWADSCACGYREYLVHFHGGFIHSPGPGCGLSCVQLWVCDAKYMRLARAWRGASDDELKVCRERLALIEKAMDGLGVISAQPKQQARAIREMVKIVKAEGAVRAVLAERFAKKPKSGNKTGKGHVNYQNRVREIEKVALGALVRMGVVTGEVGDPVGMLAAMVAGPVVEEENPA